MSSKTDPRNKTFTSASKAYEAWLNGHSFVPHTAELLASPAWRGRSLYAARFIDALELEHARHNGLENGFLKLTRRQMGKAGISSRFVADTISECEKLGLVTVTHRGGFRGDARNDASTYRLDYLPWKFVPATGAPLYYAPSDEWEKYAQPRPKSVRMGHTGDPTSVRMGHTGDPTSDSVRMGHTGDPTSDHTGDPFTDQKNDASRQNAAQPNGSPVWSHSSILRSSVAARTARSRQGEPATEPELARCAPVTPDAAPATIPADVDDLVRAGAVEHVERAIRDPVADGAAGAGSARNAWLDNLAAYVMGAFRGAAMMDALEAIEEARRAGSNDATATPTRKIIDQLDWLCRSHQSKPRPTEAIH